MSQEIWNNFEIKHKGINCIKDIYYGWGDYYALETSIQDKKTKYEIVCIYTTLIHNRLEFHINTNEKMIKRLGLPYYKHFATFSYIAGKKYFDQKDRGKKKIICLSLGTGNIGKILKNIIHEFKKHDYKINSIKIDRETGNSKDVYRIIDLKK